jgi:hypothetical protein
MWKGVQEILTRLVKIYLKDTQFVWANMEEDEELGLEGPQHG